MPAVFVHGNPETAAVWTPLLRELGRDDVTCLSPPGFGAPLPAGFEATVGGYRDWLSAELEAFDEPVDLVGHDWGGGHVLGVAMTRPDLLRSWVSDAVGIFDPDYVWHDLAREWQTPGDGEAAVARRFGAGLAERVASLVDRGITAPVAEQVAAGQDEAMGRAVLTLYRSAAQPVMARLGEHLPGAARRPGLAVVATADHVGGTEEQRHRSAARAGAATAVLPGLGHWWMVQEPRTGARALRTFWGSLPIPQSSVQP
ncbi:alpha/beta fold hydrolase [Pseudonocardia sp. KRD291]|uniref:alpha/beta fold hydrolase n=1 Tax=Pseudonocardia sp. KRD291 TaxID=2792007 RepID=UPI001C4A1621|nr:alpha/beta hydrolase [Pseudonocardia sp. KRD291]MBW0102912.1 alpha/beta fold hydrolase [Pseudonocardia sp. KRD291]